MSQSERIADLLAKAGGELVTPPTLIRAKVPLELSGETVRSRICTFIDQDGREWALRPDFTLVIAQAEVEARRSGLSGERVRRYAGPVFRLPMTPDAPVEYDQVGLEKFGAASSIEEDVWLFQTLIQASQACGVSSGLTCFGDLSIFPAFVDALELAPDLAAGLKRAFRQDGGVRAFLSGREQTRTGLSARLAGMEKEDIAAFVDDIYAMTNVRPVGLRGADEIIERLVERARSSGASISAAHQAVIERVLSLDVPLQDAPDALAAIAAENELYRLNETLNHFRARTDLLLAGTEKAFMDEARFATRFGRRFTYYDGFVFEVATPSASAPFIAGGRYDSLLGDLSTGEINTSALGGVLIPHRLPRTGGDT